MPKSAKWRPRLLKAARDAKQRALAAVQHADALMRAARHKAETEARRRKVRQAMRTAGRALKAAGKAALAAGAAAALAAIVSERSQTKAKRRTSRS